MIDLYRLIFSDDLTFCDRYLVSDELMLAMALLNYVGVVKVHLRMRIRAINRFARVWCSYFQK